MKKKKNPRNKRPQQSGNSMPAQVQTSVEVQSSVSISYRYSEKECECLFICKPEVRARERKMAYVHSEYHERIIRITRVIGHDSFSLSAYIDYMLTQHFSQCEEAVRSPYTRNYNSVF